MSTALAGSRAAAAASTIRPTTWKKPLATKFHGFAQKFQTETLPTLGSWYSLTFRASHQPAGRESRSSILDGRLRRFRQGLCFADKGDLAHPFVGRKSNSDRRSQLQS